MENNDPNPTTREEQENATLERSTGDLSQILKNSPASPTVQSESLLSFRAGKERQRLHLTLENSDSAEDRLYDTYGDSSLIETNLMLEKKKNLLSPLKKRALMGNEKFTSTKSYNQQSQVSDGELQLHDIYKESTLMEENPMLERRKISLSKLRDGASPINSPDRVLQKAFSNMFAADASIPKDDGGRLQNGRLQNHPSDSDFDEMLYDVYEDRSIIESNPMIAKRKSMSAYSDSHVDHSLQTLTYAHSNYSECDGEGRFSGVNPTHNRPVSRAPQRITTSKLDDDYENDEDWGEMLYDFYGSEVADEKNPRFFEKSKDIKKALVKSQGAKQPLRKGSTCTVPFDISTTYGVSSNGTFLVLQPRSVPDFLFVPNSAELALQPSLMVTERLTHTLTYSQQLTGKDGKIYEWIRGPTAQGWFVKLSKGGAGLSRQLKRFFVLRGRSLLCYRSEPTKTHSVALGASVVLADRKKNKVNGVDGDLSACIILGRDATMLLEKEGSKSAASTLLVIKTEQKDFTLRLRGGKHAQMEEVFIHQLKKALQLAKAAADDSKTTKPRMESVWTHPNSGTVLAAMDVVVAEAAPEDGSLSNANRTNSVRFALLRVPLESDHAKIPPLKCKPSEDRSTSHARQDSEGSAEAELFNYSLSVSVGDNTDPVHLEVLTLKHYDAAVFSSNMRCMATIGDCVIMGGSEGFLAVGVVGKSQCTLQSYDRVLYCVPARESSAMSSHHINNSKAEKGAGFYPHNLDATVVSIAISQTMQMYAAADDQGVVSFWHLETPTLDGRSSCEHWSSALDKTQKLTNVARCYKIRNQLLASIRKKRMDESIRSIKFSPDDKHLIVTTSTRVVLLSLNLDKEKWALKVRGWNELIGVANKDKAAVFSVDFVGGGSDTDSTGSSNGPALGSYYNTSNFDRIVIWKVEDCASNTTVGGMESNSKSLYEKSPHGVSTATMDTDVDLESSPIDGNNEVTASKNNFSVSISRIAWSASMWRSAYQNIKHIA